MLGRRQLLVNAVCLGGGALAVAGCRGGAGSRARKHTRGTPAQIPGLSIPKGRQLVFAASQDGGRYHIFAQRAGGSPRNLTPGRHDSNNPEVSPDGRTLVYYRTPRSGGPTVLRTHELASGHEKRISPPDGHYYYDPAWMPNGQVICKRALPDGTLGDIALINPDRLEKPRMVTDFAGGGKHIELWKPAPVDDRHVVVTMRLRPDAPTKQAANNSDILALLDLEGGDPMQLTPDDGRPHWYPAVRPGGESIVFISQDSLSADAPTRLYTVGTNGGTITPVSLANLPGDFADPSWTPNGEGLVCTYDSHRIGKLAICGMDAMGGNVGLYDVGDVGTCLSPILF